MTQAKMTEINIFSENINKKFEIDEAKAIQIARDVLKFYMREKSIFNNSCLAKEDFNCISFDILYCDNAKSHEINKEYRGKDYPADIITFAIFADSEEKFVFDGEINLGEIIISLDKVSESAKCKVQSAKYNSTSQPLNLSTDCPAIFNAELYFLISHGIMHLLGFDHQTNEDYNFIIEAQTSALKEVRGGQC